MILTMTAAHAYRFPSLTAELTGVHLVRAFCLCFFVLNKDKFAVNIGIIKQFSGK